MSEQLTEDEIASFEKYAQHTLVPWAEHTLRLIAEVRECRATPPLPDDVAGLLRRTKQGLSEAVQEHGVFGVEFVTQLYNAIESLSRQRAVLAGGVAAREDRRATILSWLEDQIGTDWECSQCGRSEYNTLPFCQNCASDAPLLHQVAFKLHAIYNEPLPISKGEKREG